jgi:hypothetical protein
MVQKKGQEMPKLARELSDAAVRQLKARKVTTKINPKTKKPNKNYGKLVTAYHPVGGVAGLLLRVTPNGGRSWILRTSVGSKRQDIGLGGYPEVGLSKARDKAREEKDQIKQGIDTVQQRKAARAALIAAQETHKTFAQVWDEFFRKKAQELSAKNVQHWRASMNNYALPVIGSMTVSDIEMRHIQNVLEPIWTTKTMMAKKVRGRLEAVLSFATVKGYRQGDNPATMERQPQGGIAQAEQAVHKVTHFRALSIDEAPVVHGGATQARGHGSPSAGVRRFVRCPQW